MPRCGSRERGAAGKDDGRLEMEDRTERIAVFEKTKMCKFHIMGVCRQGDGCRFAHERAQLHTPPDLSCTKLCKTLIATGTCNNGACRYAHNKEELRAMPNAVGAKPLVQTAGVVANPMAGTGPCSVVIGQSMPQGAPLGQYPFDTPVMHAAIAQIAQAAQAHAAEAARLQAMAATLQVDGFKQAPAAAVQFFAQGSVAGLGAVAPPQALGMPVAQGPCGGLVYAVPPPAQGLPGQGSVAAAPKPAGQVAYPPDRDCGWERRESCGSGSTLVCSDPDGGYQLGCQSSDTDSADEGGGPRARPGGPAPAPGFGEAQDLDMSGVRVRNTFLDFDAAPSAYGLRAVQTAAGRLDVMASSLD